jgi:MMP 1-O-methyltransferase
MALLRKFRNWLDERKFRRALSKIEKYKAIEGWLSEKEAVGLFDVARRLKPNSVVVEIGSWKGKSTYCLAMGLKAGKVFAIDPFNAEGEPGSKEIYEQTRGDQPLLEQFRQTFEENGLSQKVEPKMGYSSLFIGEFPVIDFLFIDGDHSIPGCDFDFTHYAPKIKEGGFLAFHDFNPSRDELGPTWVIKNKVLNNPEYRVHGVFDSLWIAEKLK